MTPSEVSQELGKSAGVLLVTGIVKEMIQAGVALDEFEHSGCDLQDFVIAANFLLHGKLTRMLYFLFYLKLLGLVLDHDHISELLKHVDHFSQAVNFKFAHFFDRRDTVRVESIEYLISYRVVTMGIHERLPCPLSLSRAGHVSHKHRKMLFKLVHVSVLTREKRSQGFIVHDFSEDFIDKYSHTVVSAHFFEKRPG